VACNNGITTNWKYEGYAGNSYVTFQLEEEKEETNLKVRTKVVEDFQDDVPEFSRESCLGGWNYFLDRLNMYLSKKTKRKQMSKIFQFGEKVEGYNIPVLNEREIRAGAGILFLIMFIWLSSNYYSKP